MTPRTVTGRRVRVAVIGAGWWSGRVHLPTLVADPEAEIVVVYDRTASRAQDAASRFEIPAWTDRVADVLDHDIDVALISSANHVHYDHARVLIEAGVDVLVEKPMTVDPVQAWELVDLAAQHGSRLHVGYTFVHSPIAQAIRTRLSAGDLGDVVMSTALFATAIQRLLRGVGGQQPSAEVPYSPSVATWADPRHGGGQAHGQLTHATSLLLWLLDAKPTEVVAFADSLGAQVDLVDTMSIRTATSGLISMNTTSTVIAHDERVEEYRIFGTDGHLRLDTTRWAYDVVTRGEATSLVEADPAGMMSRCEQAPARTLVRAALGAVEVRADGVLGARTTSLICAAIDAAASGGVVAVADSVASARSALVAS